MNEKVDKEFNYQHHINESTAYLQTIGLGSQTKKFVEFWEGKQWPAKTEATKSLPRPVINFIKMIGSNKISGILSSRVKLHFMADVDDAATIKFDKFAAYIQKEMKQSYHDSRALKDGAKKGTYVAHYYWDAEARGKKGNYKGALRCEVIDPMNIRFANPNETDEQKQKWFMILSRETVEAVKAAADVEDPTIGSDSNDSFYNEVEQDHTQFVTVATRYFRKNGEVYYEKATHGGVFQKARPLTPDIKKMYAELEKQTNNSKSEDEGETGMPDDPNKEISDTKQFNLEEKMTMYPIAVESWDERDKSIYGIGEVESLMPNQRAVNFGFAMNLLKIQNEAWGKIITKPDALNGQVITNKPGQIITDYSTKFEKGIYAFNDKPMNINGINVIETLMEATRAVTGSTEVMTGEVLGGNMSGAAISALQAQASQPLKEKQQRFWRFKEKQGLILAQFFKFYYDNYNFSYKETDENGDETTKKDIFNGSEFIDKDISVVVEAGAASSYSESSDISMLTFLLEKDAISVETFINAYPENALSKRTEIIELVKKEKESQFVVMAQQLEQAKQQLQRAAEIVKQQNTAIDQAATMVTENQNLKKIIIQLGSEFTQKLTEANGQLTQATMDAMKFAQELEKQGQQPKVTTPLTEPKAKPKEKEGKA